VLRRVLTLVALTAVVAVAAPVRAQTNVPSDFALRETDGIEIQDRRGAELPRDVMLTAHDGRAVALGEYLDGSRPTLLVLAYYSCPQLCTVVLNGVLAGIKGLDFAIGKDFRVVVVSIDPRDTTEVAAAKRKNYLEAYGHEELPPGDWDFLIGSEAQVRRLADTVGFPYRWDPVSQQYAHAAGVFLLTPHGKLSNTLYGITFPSRDLKFSLMEASQGQLGTAWDKVFLRCFHWDPNARGYKLAALQLMKIGGLITVVGLTFLILMLRRAERRRRLGPKTKATEHAHAIRT
jgi:protein SCO1/2